MIGTRANGGSFDDRVGCAALFAGRMVAGRAEFACAKGRDVTFVWSTGEEEGLVGAAKTRRGSPKSSTCRIVFSRWTRLSARIRRWNRSDMRTRRSGKASWCAPSDRSNIVPPAALRENQKLARANQIPMQYGVTSGGNDGSAFVRYGTLDVALGWPLRYSHSPAEVIDTRDVDALARIIAAVARWW